MSQNMPCGNARNCSIMFNHRNLSCSQRGYKIYAPPFPPAFSDICKLSMLCRTYWCVSLHFYLHRLSCIKPVNYHQNNFLKTREIQFMMPLKQDGFGWGGLRSVVLLCTNKKTILDCTRQYGQTASGTSVSKTISVRAHARHVIWPHCLNTARCRGCSL